MPTKPAGKFNAFSAVCTRPCTRTEVCGWPGCALTTTEQPAARAEAVSPPSTENAKGKLLAENMATGPSGTRTRCMAGWPAGGPPATAGSSVKAKAAPCCARPAKRRNWNAVRSNSPFNRGEPRPDSWSAKATKASRSDSMAVAKALSKAARVAPSLHCQSAKAAWAACTAASMSALEEAVKAAPKGWPVRASKDCKVVMVFL